MNSLSRYRLVRPLGRGGQAVVYLAEDEDGRPVALKVFREQQSADERERLRRELLLTKRINHPGICRVLGVERDGDAFFLVMDVAPGTPLSSVLASGPLPVERSLRILIRVLDAVAAAHDVGVVHRDLKPQNLLVDHRDRVVIVDFGIASADDLERLTAEHLVVGTRRYIAPEVWLGAPVSPLGDIFALGVVLYEALTGVMPYESASKYRPEIVPPSARRPSLPALVDAVVLRALAAEPAQRWPNARAFADALASVDEALRLGLAAPQAARAVEAAASMQDAETVPRRRRTQMHAPQRRFEVPPKLYGRDREQAALRRAIERFRGARRALVAISGYSGVGKSTLAKEARDPIIRGGGYFVQGKFPQRERRAPYECVLRALDDLLGEIAEETESPRWTVALSQAVGPSGGVLTERLPSLERIIGRQRPVPELSPAEAQRRFHRLLGKLVAAVATPERPLALFLDDMQWADHQSLELVRRWLLDERVRGLLVIGAYRDDESDACQPLVELVSALQRESVDVTEIAVSPLDEPTLGQLVADALSSSPTAAARVTAAVFQKTLGNPFFVSQLLLELHARGLIVGTRSMDEPWTWDETAIERAEVNDDVVGFMTKRLGELSDETREVLQYAAALGARFDFETLASASSISREQVSERLSPVLVARLVLAVPEAGRASDDAIVSDGEAAPANAAYRFLHDRVQEAAYELIPLERRPRIHLRIAELMLRDLEGDPRLEARVFELVRHFGAAVELVKDRALRIKVARLHALAGAIALRAAAYEAAARYLVDARALLPEDAWATEPRLAYDVTGPLAHALYLQGEIAVADEMFTWLSERAIDGEEQTALAVLQMQLYIDQSRPLDVLQIARRNLARLGCDVPAERAATDAAAERHRARFLAGLDGRPVPSLAELPEVLDPRTRQIMQIVTGALPAAYLCDRSFYNFLGQLFCALSVEHVNTL